MSAIMLENWGHLFDTNKLERKLRKKHAIYLNKSKELRKIVSVIKENNYHMHTKTCQKMLRS